MTNAERRAAVLSKVEEKLREIWPDVSGDRTFGTFDDLEAMAARTGDQLSQEVMSAGLREAMAGVSDEQSSKCPQCGRALQWSRTSKGIATIRGPVQLERDYGYCRGCRNGFSPR